MGKVILPTHTCFDDALDFITDRVKANPLELRLGRLVLVHAIAIIPTGKDAGERFSHAWVEEVSPMGDQVAAWQQGFLNGKRVLYSQLRADLYAELQPQAVWRYTLRQVALENAKHGTYGPWVPELQELCKKKRKTG